MRGRLFNGEHNLRVRSGKTILELEPGLDAGRADPGAETPVRPMARMEPSINVIMEHFWPRAIFLIQFGDTKKRSIRAACPRRRGN